MWYLHLEKIIDGKPVRCYLVFETKVDAITHIEKVEALGFKLVALTQTAETPST